jgi:hypothetical protein
MAAEDPDADAHLILGFRYLYGVGVRADCETSLGHYRQAADLGPRAAPPAHRRCIAHCSLTWIDKLVAAAWLEAGHVDGDDRPWLEVPMLGTGGADASANAAEVDVQFYQLAAAYGAPLCTRLNYPEALPPLPHALKPTAPRRRGRDAGAGRLVPARSTRRGARLGGGAAAVRARGRAGPSTRPWFVIGTLSLALLTCLL